MAKLIIQGAEHDLGTGGLTWGEAEQIELLTGLPFGEYEKALESRSVAAIKALLLTMWKRVDPAVTLADLNRLATSDVVLVEDAPPGGEADKPNRQARRARPTAAG